MKALTGVLLHVRARDSDPSLGPVDLDVEVPLDAQRQVVLRDLIVLRHVGIEVVLAVEQGMRRDPAIERQADQHQVLDRAPVRHRQGSRLTETYRACLRIRLCAERGGAVAEHLRARGELDVNLEPYDGLVRAHVVTHNGGADTGPRACS